MLCICIVRARVVRVCVFCVHAHACVIVCMHTRVSGESRPWRWQEHRSQKLWGHVGRSQGTEPLAGKAGRWAAERKRERNQRRMKGLGGLLGLARLRAFCPQAAVVPRIPVKKRKSFRSALLGKGLVGRWLRGHVGASEGHLRQNQSGRELSAPLALSTVKRVTVVTEDGCLVAGRRTASAGTGLGLGASAFSR